MPLWETDGKCSDDTLSREISRRNAARTIRGGDFSTPLRYGRNDGRARAGFFIICGEAATTTLGAKGPVKLKNPPAARPVHLKNLPL